MFELLVFLVITFYISDPVSIFLPCLHSTMFYYVSNQLSYLLHIGASFTINTKRIIPKLIFVDS